MNSEQIREVLDTLIAPSACDFVGVFPKDLIPTNITKFPSCYVANSDDSHLAGTHWLAFYWTAPDSCEFFDSFALSPFLYGFDLDDTDVCKLNSKAIQSSYSIVCGQYCIYFLYNRSLGHSLSSILHSFSVTNLEINDDQVARFYHKISKYACSSCSRHPYSLCPRKQCCTTQKTIPLH